MVLAEVGAVATSPLRTLDLLQWSLQLLGLATLVLSSHLQLHSLSLALALVLWAAVPSWVKARASTQVSWGSFES